MRGLVVILIVWAVSPPAWAHAFLDRASPPVGADVTIPPTTVSLTFSEPVESSFSSIQVTDADGVRVDVGKPISDGDGRILRTSLRPLRPGTYAVQWHVTSVDTHKTEGHFRFTIKP